MKRKMLIGLVLVCVMGINVNAAIYEDWESVPPNRCYPAGWSHSGGGNAGIVKAGVGVGGSQALQLVGETTALDGYYRYFDPTLSGHVEIMFTINNAAGGIHILTLGEQDYNPRFDLSNISGATGSNYYFTGKAYDSVDTGVALPAAGQWHKIVYEWYTDNSDYLEINGTEVTIPATWSNHRAYGGYPPNDPMTAGIIRFGVSSVDTVATWDNIVVVPEPATMALLLAGGMLIRRRK